MTRMTPAYDELARSCTRLHHFQHLHDVAYWDQATMMPASGNEARAAALAEVSALTHALRIDPARGALIEAAQAEPLDDFQRANLREIRRDWLRATALPDELVRRRALATARCEHAWRTQRPANDWKGFLPNLREVVEVTREEARRLSDRNGLSLYDSMLDQYEPGMRSAEVARIFADVRDWLPGLIRDVIARQADDRVLVPHGPFDLAGQRALCQDVMDLLGFDFRAGRLDESTHPFTGGVPEDVRMTTRFREDTFLESLLGTIHETGHGCYEQNLPRNWLGQPVALARSMGIHESQSLAYEMQLATHPGFARLLGPLLSRHFGHQDAFEPDNLHLLLNRVKVGPVRVEADQVTYPAHILVRFDIERALIDGEIGVADIPAVWNDAMRDLLGLDLRGNYRNGPMQDLHWPEGMFGYFPCYTLGAMYAAQWFAVLRRRYPDLDQRIAAGDLGVIIDWMRENIWNQASRWTTEDLVLRASGQPLDPSHLRAHLLRRYLPSSCPGP